MSKNSASARKRTFSLPVGGLDLLAMAWVVAPSRELMQGQMGFCQDADGNEGPKLTKVQA